jgi:hypothetical protein
MDWLFCSPFFVAGKWAGGGGGAPYFPALQHVDTSHFFSAGGARNPRNKIKKGGKKGARTHCSPPPL